MLIIHRDEPSACVRAVAAFRTQGVPVNVTVVDNASTSASLETLKEAVTDVDLVATGSNAGFGPAANIGLRKWLQEGSGEWVVVAPHDSLPQPDCLRRILEVADGRTDAGLLSAEYGPGHEYKPVVDRYLGGYVEPASPGEGWEDADFPHGTLLVARRAALAEIGLFDERYFAYCEEADLGMRATRAGWGVGIVWGAVVSNPAMSEGDLARYLKLRNTLLLVREHFGRYPAFMRCVIAVCSITIRSLKRGASESAMTHERRLERRAILDFLRGDFGPPPEELIAPAAPA